MLGIEPLRQPAGQHRAAHLAGAGQRDGAVDFFERVGVCSHRTNTLSSSRRKPGLVTTGSSSLSNCLQQAPCDAIDVTAYRFRLKAGTTTACGETVGPPYASPSVSNIAALMASAALLPAQTTNWNAG